MAALPMTAEFTQIFFNYYESNIMVGLFQNLEYRIYFKKTTIPDSTQFLKFSTPLQSRSFIFGIIFIHPRVTEIYFLCNLNVKKTNSILNILKPKELLLWELVS